MKSQARGLTGKDQAPINHRQLSYTDMCVTFMLPCFKYVFGLGQFDNHELLFWPVIHLLVGHPQAMPRNALLLWVSVGDKMRAKARDCLCNLLLNANKKIKDASLKCFRRYINTHSCLTNCFFSFVILVT